MPEYARCLLRPGVITQLGLLTGCIRAGLDLTDIRAANENTESHTITMTVTGDFSPRLAIKTLCPEEAVTFPEIIPLLDYDHTFNTEVHINRTVKM